MEPLIYLAASFIGLTASWLVWDQGFKKCFLDGLREQLFELRFRLFRIAAEGQIDFDDEAYRAIELQICGLIRFAHRMTFATLIFSAREQERAKRLGEFVDHRQLVLLKVSRTAPNVRDQLECLLNDLHKTTMVYIGLSSLPMLLTLALGSSLLVRRSKSKLTNAFEEEAFRAECRIGRYKKPVMA